MSLFGSNLVLQKFWTQLEHKENLEIDDRDFVNNFKIIAEDFISKNLINEFIDFAFNFLSYIEKNNQLHFKKSSFFKICIETLIKSGQVYESTKFINMFLFEICFKKKLGLYCDLKLNSKYLILIDNNVDNVFLNINLSLISNILPEISENINKLWILNHDSWQEVSSRVVELSENFISLNFSDNLCSEEIREFILILLLVNQKINPNTFIKKSIESIILFPFNLNIHYLIINFYLIRFYNSGEEKFLSSAKNLIEFIKLKKKANKKFYGRNCIYERLSILTKKVNEIESRIKNKYFDEKKGSLDILETEGKSLWAEYKKEEVFQSIIQKKLSRNATFSLDKNHVQNEKKLVLKITSEDNWKTVFDSIYYNVINCDFEEAIKKLERVILLKEYEENEYASIIYLLAKIHHLKGDYNVSVQYVQEIINNYHFDESNVLSFYQLLIMNYKHLDNISKALEVEEIILKLRSGKC
jgi:hypothetical protein